MPRSAWRSRSSRANRRPGLVMLIIAVVLVVVGAFWMRSLVKVEA